MQGDPAPVTASDDSVSVVLDLVLDLGSIPVTSGVQGRDYGVSNRGELNAWSKLTADIVADCRTRFRAGETQDALAAETGVSSGAMCNAIRGKTWAGPQCGVEPVLRELRPSQATAAFRDQMARKGSKGAAARWHPESSQAVEELAPVAPG